MSKPAFDPNQPFEAEKPAFDPNQPFDSGDSQDMPQQQMGGSPPLGFVAKQMAGMLPQANLLQNAPATGAVLGSMVAPGPGTAIGAGVGQIAKRMGDIYSGSPVQSPMQEAIGPMAQAAVGGIPDVSGVINAGKTTVAEGIGNALAKAGHTLSGVRPDILKQTYKQGLSTYGAPSLDKASQIFGDAIGPEGQAAMQQTAKDAFDPALGKARALAIDIGTKVEQGQPVSALEALQAKQATDRVISATPVTDDKTLSSLYGWKSKFDEIMSSQNGPLKEASNIYRKAIVKDTILNPTRITKSGKPSAFLPLVLGAGGRSAEGIVNTLVGTSPAAWGLGAAVSGSIPKIANRAALAAFISKITTKESGR